MRNPYVVNALRMGAKSGIIFSILYFLTMFTSNLLGKGYFKDGLTWFSLNPEWLNSFIAGGFGILIFAIVGFLIGMLISIPYTKWWLNRIMKKHYG